MATDCIGRYTARGLDDAMRRGIAGFHDSFFTSPRETVRAPHRLRQKRGTDLARLREPLPVIGGDL
jgi:hypothetical protein